MTPDDRRAAAEQVYGPAARRLRRVGVSDFELLVVPVTPTAPRDDQALAVGRGGRLQLTRRGRNC
jgi:hypothetical protein